MKVVCLAKKIIAGLALVATGVVLHPAVANESWPNRPVQFVVPVDSGNVQDGIARKLAMELSAKWNQPVNVVNQPGGGGALGTNTVATAASDGYTIGVVSATFTGALAARNNLPYARDKLIGVISFGRQELMIFAGKNMPFDNVQQMVDYARANPNKLDYATPGLGTLVNISMEHLAKVKDLKVVHVPYKNLIQAVPDVASGRVHVLLTSAFPAIQSLIATGDIKIVGSLGKNAKYNNVSIPSVSGVAPEVHATGYFALIAPAGTPKHVIDKIHKDVSSVISTSEFQQHLISLGGVVEPPSRPGEFDRWIDLEIDRLKKIIVQTGIKIQ